MRLLCVYVWTILQYVRNPEAVLENRPRYALFVT